MLKTPDFAAVCCQLKDRRTNLSKRFQLHAAALSDQGTLNKCYGLFVVRGSSILVLEVDMHVSVAF
jgi:hypothetical protein